MYAARVLVVLGIALGLAAAVALIWFVHRALLVLFVGVLLGILIDAVAGRASRLLGVSRRSAARAVVLALAIAGAIAAASVVPEGIAQMNRIGEAVPDLVEDLRRTAWGARLIEAMPPTEEVLADLRLVTAASEGVLAGMGGTVAVLFVGAWIGVAPRRHIAGVVRVLPPESRPRAIEVGNAARRALQHWIVGRLVDMSVLSVLTTAGLWLLGMPYALPLGIIAGFLEFVPYLGPVLAVLPAAAVALTVDPDLLLRVVLLYFALQTVQTYLVTPLIEQRAVHVPPAVVLSVQAVMASLAGALGVLVATPLAVVAIVVVQSLYLRDLLNEEVSLLGDDGRAAGAPPPVGA